MMAILKNERINRAVTDNQLIDETIDKVVNKLKP